MLRIAKFSSLILGALLLVTVAKADNHEGGVHGALDVYWNTNQDGGNNTGANPAGLNHNDFSVGLATFNFAGSAKHVDYYLELAMGGQAAATGASNTSDPVSQAYVTHHVNDQISVTVGRMASNVGFEGAFAKDNWNYSRSIGFTNGQPLWHEGAAVRYNHNSGFSAGLFVYDGEEQIDQPNANPAGPSTLNESTGATSLQLSYGMDKWAVVYNYYKNADDDNEVLHNVNFTYDFNSKFSAALAHIMGEVDEENNDQAWTSTAIYLKYMVSKKTYAAFRYEMWNDEEGYLLSSANTDEDLTSMTFTYGLYCDSGSEFRFEVRQDSADLDIFVADEDNTAEDSQMNVSAAWITTF